MDNSEFVKLDSRAIDITGQRFGRLTVLGPIASKRNGTRWLCVCDCGRKTEVRGSCLRAGTVKSCRCSWGRTPTHGMTNTLAFQVWHGMKDRCSNPKNESYPHYGGRGISICAEWVNSFEAFYEHVSKLPHFQDEGYSIDRIDNDGNYEPGNVRWANVIEQRRNQRRNRFITIDNVTRTAIEWASISGIASTTIRKRLDMGWSEYDAVFKPIQYQREALAAKIAA